MYTIDGMGVGCTVINNLMYANDAENVAHLEAKLQQMFDIVVEESEENGSKYGSTCFTVVFSIIIYNSCHLKS